MSATASRNSEGRIRLGEFLSPLQNRARVRRSKTRPGVVQLVARLRLRSRPGRPQQAQLALCRRDGEGTEHCRAHCGPRGPGKPPMARGHKASPGRGSLPALAGLFGAVRRSAGSAPAGIWAPARCGPSPRLAPERELHFPGRFSIHPAFPRRNWAFADSRLIAAARLACEYASSALCLSMYSSASNSWASPSASPRSLATPMARSKVRSASSLRSPALRHRAR